jgi:biotin synthase-related radical SAM superfamily protein
LYTLKRFVKVKNAHILIEENKTKLYKCNFDESSQTMEKSSMPMDVSKMRTIVAKSANTGAKICGICAGALYSE